MMGQFSAAAALSLLLIYTHTVTGGLESESCQQERGYIILCTCSTITLANDTVYARTQHNRSETVCQTKLQTEPGLFITVKTGIRFETGPCGKVCGQQSFVKVADEGVVNSQVCKCNVTLQADIVLLNSRSSSVVVSYRDSRFGLSLAAYGCRRSELFSGSNVEIISPSVQPSYGVPYTVNLTCANGFMAEGLYLWTTKTCLVSPASPIGLWEGSKVSCKRIKCEPPSVPSNGGFTPVKEEYCYLNSITYHCGAGYELIQGTSQRYCVAVNGDGPMWNSTNPVCQRRSCGEPPSISNSVLSEGGTLFGDTRNVSCSIGYNISGPSTIACEADGDWSDTPVCTIVRCPLNPSVENALADQADVGSYEQPVFGSRIIFTCERGYLLQGKAEIACKEDGTWTPTPTCQLAECGPAPIVTNGSCIDCDGNHSTYKSFHHYKCQDGFQFQWGIDYVTCTEFGSWSVTPVCKKRDCGIPEDTLHGNWTFTSTDFLSKALLFCQPGYEVDGSTNISVCQSDGRWSPKPLCISIDCGRPEVVPHGTIDNITSTTYMSVVTYVCEKGYRLSSNFSQIQCQIDGTWSRPPTCSILSCGEPPKLGEEFGVAELIGDTSYGSEVIFLCPDGYMLERDSRPLRCLETGLWSDLPRCVEVDCDVPKPVSGGLLVAYNESSYGSTAMYRCTSDGVTVSTKTAVCGSGGRWSYPNCQSSTAGRTVSIYLAGTVVVMCIIIIILLVLWWSKRKTIMSQFKTRRAHKKPASATDERDRMATEEHLLENCNHLVATSFDDTEYRPVDDWRRSSNFLPPPLDDTQHASGSPLVKPRSRQPIGGDIYLDILKASELLGYEGPDNPLYGEMKRNRVNRPQAPDGQEDGHGCMELKEFNPESDCKLPEPLLDMTITADDGRRMCYTPKWTKTLDRKPQPPNRTQGDYYQTIPL